VALARALEAAAALEGLLPEAEAWAQRARRAVRGREAAAAAAGGAGNGGAFQGTGGAAAAAELAAGEGFGNLRAAVGAAAGMAEAAARVDLRVLESRQAEAVGALVERGRAVLVEATRAARAQCQLGLAGLGWPPPPGGKPGSAAGLLRDAAPEPVRDLIECLASLEACQAADRLLSGSGEGDGERWLDGEDGAGAGLAAAALAPPSWAGLELARGLRLRLDYHFGPDGQAGRLDKPEWALDYALKAARAMRDAALPLEQDVPGLAQAVALAGGVVASGWFGGGLLPRMLQAAESPAARDQYLLHAADEAISFDRQVLGAALGIDVEGSFGAEPTSPVAPWGYGRCLAACADGPAGEAWLGAERREAIRRLDGFVTAGDAWVRSGGGSTVPGVGEGGGDDTFGLSISSAGALAPKCALDAVFLFESLAGRCMALLRPRHCQAFMEEVFCPAFKHFADRMGRRLQSFGALGPLHEPAAVEGLGQVLCLLEYVEGELAELSELPFFVEIEAAAGGEGGWLGPMVGHLEELRAAWADRVTRAAVQRFDSTSSKYRIEVVKFREEPCNHKHGEATDSLQPALQQLREVLELLRAHFPRPTFRRVWRALARAVHDSVLESVPFRGTFSPAGALQYVVDCDLLVAVFAPYAPDPSVFFRALLETARVMGLPQADADALTRAAAASPAGAPPGPCAGCEALSAEQVAWLLERRLDCRAP